MGLEVLLYVPNLIGYIRVLLVLAAWAGFNNPEIFVPCYGISVILDGVDGFVARRLKQTSELGAWLDVVIDNTGRGCYGACCFSGVGWCPHWNGVCSCVITETMVLSGNAPSLRVLVGSGLSWPTVLKSPLGVLAISGLHILPMWLYGLQMGILTQILHLPAWLQTLGTLLLSMGRLLCLSVEIWCIWTHVRFLTRNQTLLKKVE